MDIIVAALFAALITKRLFPYDSEDTEIGLRTKVVLLLAAVVVGGIVGLLLRNFR